MIKQKVEVTEAMDANEKLRVAMRDFVMDSPFFASILLKLNIVEDTEHILPFPTMGTDGDELRWSREFVDTLTVDVVKGVIVHELMHVVGLHHLRRGDRDPLLWNVGCDLAINPIVAESGFVLPSGTLADHNFEGMEAEKIYARLLKDQKMQQKLVGSGDGKGNQKAFGCGSVYDKKNQDGSDMSKSQMKAAELEQKIANDTAAKIHEKQCGNLPAFLQRMIGELSKPKVNWKEALAQFVAINSKSDYSWAQPNNRYVAQGVYLPKTYKPEIGEVVNLIDASGSISDEELKEEVAELKGILFAYEGVTMKIIFFDTQAGQPIEVTDETEVKAIKIGGFGGGTDYRPPFKMVDTAQLDPVCVIVLTDGYCSSFPVAPEVPVLWVLVQANDSFKPPFGSVIEMNIRELER